VHPILPQARLLTIEGGAHFPWIEAPEKIFGAIRAFLSGQWPKDAEKVSRVDPKNQDLRRAVENRSLIAETEASEHNCRLQLQKWLEF
jgi:hypothetical protein